MDRYGKQKPMNMYGGSNEIKRSRKTIPNMGPGDSTLAEGYCNTEWGYCPSPLWPHCNGPNWAGWCNCWKEVLDATNTEFEFDNGIYYCSHNGSPEPPCLSQTQCQNQAWFKNCSCQLITASGTCPAMQCTHCGEQGEYIEGWGMQYWYYPDWFMDSCTAPYAWETGQQGGWWPPKAWVRRGGRITRNKRRGGGIKRNKGRGGRTKRNRGSRRRRR